MKNLFNGFKQMANDVVNSKSITVPITEDMLLFVLKHTTEKIEENDISNLDVSLQEDSVRISGKIKKMLMQIPFEIVVIPVKAEKRILYFELKKMKPLNQSWIKGKVLNKPPYVTYEKDVLTIDLNRFDVIKAIPVGKIHKFEMKDNKLNVSIGL